MILVRRVNSGCKLKCKGRTSGKINRCPYVYEDNGKRIGSVLLSKCPRNEGTSFGNEQQWWIRG